MAGVKYTPPKRRFADVANGREIKASLRQVGGKAARWMESVAPVDTGRYKASFTVEDERSAQIVGSGDTGAIETSAVRVVANVPYAVYVERGNGTAKFRGYHIFRRCLERLKTL